jgi:hypothetical protein
LEINQVNIGIIGWWHHNNAGDSTILNSLIKALAPHHVVPIDSPFDINDDVLRRLNRLDFLILGGGGLFQEVPPRPFDTFDFWGQYLQTPIGVAGVGVDVVSPEYHPAVAALVDQSRFFYVRDRDSQQAIDHPKVQVAPDLTFLYPRTNTLTRGARLQHSALCGVNLRISPGLEVEQWLKTLHQLPLRFRGIPLSTFGAWREMQTLQKLDEACTTTFDSALYTDLDLVVGTAFHSVVFAIQATVPVIAIAYAPKVRRLMTDIGLEHYVLEPDEWHRLPELVERLMDEHEELSSYLQETTRRLSESARQTLAAMREEIEQVAKPHDQYCTKVSLVILGSTSNQANHATLESCLAQTHKDVEIILATESADTAPDTLSWDPRVTIVRCAPNASVGERLNRAMAQATGDYLSWLAAGDYYALDAISCMVDRLQHEPGCDIVFTDYYRMHDTARIADPHPAGKISNLSRRNVIGPCFLYRRKLGETVGPFSTDAALVAYNYWLRAQSSFDLEPIHARLFYALLANEAANVRQLERKTRHQWRSTDPAPSRFLWRIVDSEIVETALIQPLLALRNKARTMCAPPDSMGRSRGLER